MQPGATDDTTRSAGTTRSASDGNGSGRTQADGDRVTEPLQADRSLGDLFGDLTQELSTLMRQEVELGRAELREEAQRAAKAAGGFAGAGVGAWMCVLFVSLTVAWLLDHVMDRALAFAIVAIAWAVAAAILFQMGRRRMKDVEPLPQTTQSIKEDVQWLNAQRS